MHDEACETRDQAALGGENATPQHSRRRTAAEMVPEQAELLCDELVTNSAATESAMGPGQGGGATS